MYSNSIFTFWWIFFFCLFSLLEVYFGELFKFSLDRKTTHNLKKELFRRSHAFQGSTRWKITKIFDLGTCFSQEKCLPLYTFSPQDMVNPSGKWQQGSSTQSSINMYWSKCTQDVNTLGRVNDIIRNEKEISRRNLTIQ